MPEFHYTLSILYTQHLPKTHTNLSKPSNGRWSTFHISVTHSYFYSQDLCKISGILMSLNPPTAILAQTFFSTPSSIWIWTVTHQSIHHSRMRHLIKVFWDHFSFHVSNAEEINYNLTCIVFLSIICKYEKISIKIKAQQHVETGLSHPFQT